jgi:hypothetical protein
MSAGYIYILCEREFITTGQNVYKIVMTGNVVQRMGQYPKGSLLLFTQYTDNVQSTERSLINMFNAEFKARQDIGSEYFQGDVKAMMTTIFNYIMSNMTSNTTKNQEIQPFDSSMLIMEYIDHSRAKLNKATLKAKDVYTSFLKWASDNSYLNNITFFIFTKELKKLYNIVAKPHRFPSGMDNALIFPYMSPPSINDPDLD